MIEVACIIHSVNVDTVNIACQTNLWGSCESARQKEKSIMKIAVFGATGRTGGIVVDKALEQGYDVTVLVRDPSRINLKHARLSVVSGSPISANDVGGCLSGVDGVIHCLGIGGKGDGKQTTLISDSVKIVLAGMNKHGVKRLVCMSNIGAGGSGSWFAHRIVIPIFLRWLRPIIDDKDRMEAALSASNVEWISVRLPYIKEGKSKPIRVSTNGRGLGLTITADSAAQFLLEQLISKDFVGSMPCISN